MTKRLLRGMRPGPDREPVLVASTKGLGIRVPIDIKVDNQGFVHPGKEGLSCCTETRDVPFWALPRSLGGEVDGWIVYAIDENQLPALLSAVPCPTNLHKSHHVVAPSQSCRLENYVESINSTKSAWIAAYE